MKLYTGDVLIVDREFADDKMDTDFSKRWFHKGDTLVVTQVCSKGGGKEVCGYFFNHMGKIIQIFDFQIADLVKTGAIRRLNGLERARLRRAVRSVQEGQENA